MQHLQQVDLDRPGDLIERYSSRIAAEGIEQGHTVDLGRYKYKADQPAHKDRPDAHRLAGDQCDGHHEKPDKDLGKIIIGGRKYGILNPFRHTHFVGKFYQQGIQLHKAEAVYVSFLLQHVQIPGLYLQDGIVHIAVQGHFFQPPPR